MSHRNYNLLLRQFFENLRNVFWRFLNALYDDFVSILSDNTGSRHKKQVVGTFSFKR